MYSTEALQRLVLSLIKSIHQGKENLDEPMQFILSQYVVYNFRGTLELIKKDLLENDITIFARQLFEKIIEEFEHYFEQLKNISVEKELSPYREHLLLKNFYMRHQFSDLPKTKKKYFFMDMMKSVKVNSEKWAIRRPEELKHDVKPLGHVSVSSEFPSGEYLNPVSQEYIRHTCQKIRKDEINTN